ncbi:hypothetical protein JB92DRAFT_2759088 [Gautieria morchelliformis]|nr:hypothetical protein JB92DRAFT_2759088 [Gautieria morchelliformis]
MLVLNLPLVKAMWPFAPKRFTSNSLIGAGALGLSDSGRVVAFGDLNGDQFMDVLMLDKDQQTLVAYLWNHDNFVFEPSSSFRHSQKVVNVVPGDFNNDGRLDLLVMSEGQRQGVIDMAVYFSDLQGGFVSPPIQVPSSTNLQSMVVDSNGDMKIDLLGIPATSVGGDHSSPLRLWKNVWNGTSGSPALFEVVDPIFELDDDVCNLSQTHSNAFLDFDGDCLADIFLSCNNMNEGTQSFQIWLNAQDDQGFYLGQSGQLPSGAGQITFADMNRDGTIDMVFPTCASVDSSTGVGRDCMINIAYNKQLPLCTSTASSRKPCRSPQSLCTRDPNFQFDLDERASNDAFVRINLTSLFPSSPYLLMNDMTHDPPIPLPIRVGDFSLDGFPDLIPIVASAPKGGVFGVGGSIERTPYLMTSVPCARGVAGCGASGQGRRGFRITSAGSEALQQIVDARGVTVLDLDEDGTLDILVQRTGEQGSGTNLFVHNNFFYDAFFLKAMVLNRPCDGGWCTMTNGTKYEGFGVSYSGASYKYTVQDTSGRRSAAQVAQLPQTAYHSLHTPYSFFGLGRTNNYIENLFVGSTKKHDTFINMEGVIPNSKVVIIPSPQGEKDGWKRELFLRPGAWIPWVTLTVVLSTVIFAVVVFVLHLNEKREDELERRRASHHINFDAL